MVKTLMLFPIDFNGKIYLADVNGDIFNSPKNISWFESKVIQAYANSKVVRIKYNSSTSVVTTVETVAIKPIEDRLKVFVELFSRTPELFTQTDNPLSKINDTIITAAAHISMQQDMRLFMTDFLKRTLSLKNDKNTNEATEMQDTKVTTPNPVRDEVKNCYSLKPNDFIMDALTWKYLYRSVLRGENIMMTGPAGFGKTGAILAIKDVFKDRNFYYVNLGSTQDPRATLVGNTGFNKETGTMFHKSAFVKAIETPNTIIMLDEITRSHPEAWNILMTVLDKSQRYLRLDEAEGSPIIPVAEGVTFMATANIGVEYTATRVIDRAIKDRFVDIEIRPMDEGKVRELLQIKYGNTISNNRIKAISTIYSGIKNAVESSEQKLGTYMSIRVVQAVTELMIDGFTLEESIDVAVIPFYSNDGHPNSERNYVKQIVQKVITLDKDDEPVSNVKKPAAATVSEVKADADDTDFRNKKPF